MRRSKGKRIRDLGSEVAATNWGYEYTTDGKNSLSGTRERIRSLKSSGKPYAVIVAPGVVIFDADHDTEDTIARTFYDQLKEDGVTCFCVRSGGTHANGNPRRHLWARFHDQARAEIWIDRAKALGIEIKKEGDKIRPPGSPHRNGSRSTLDWGATEEAVLAFVQEAGPKPNPEIALPEWMRKEVGEYIKRARNRVPRKKNSPQLEDRSAGMLNIAEWLHILGWGESSFKNALSEAKCNNGKSPKWAWQKAGRSVNERRANITEWADQVKASGILSPRDEHVIEAIKAYALIWGAYSSKGLEVEISFRNISEYVNIHHATAGRKLKRLIDAGWLIDVSDTKPHANRGGLRSAVYRLTSPQNVMPCNNTPPYGGEEGDFLYCRKTLRFEFAETDDELTAYTGCPSLAAVVALMRGAMSQGKGLLTAAEIGAAMGIDAAAVRVHLRKLKALGQVTRQKGGRYLLHENILKVIADRNLIARSARDRRNIHERERQAERLRRQKAARYWELKEKASRPQLPPPIEAITCSPMAPTLPHVADPELEIEVGGKSDQADLRAVITLV